MKTTFKLFGALLFTLCFFTASAQYSAAAGVRIEDDWLLGDYKKTLNETMTGEVFAGIETISFIDLFKVGIEIDINTEVEQLDGLRWYYGGGGSLVFGDVSWIEVFGAGGAEYTFEEIPLNISLALLPTILLGDNLGDNFAVNFALGARYVLNQ